MNVESRNKVLGTLSAFQTILENYPKLMASDYYGGKDTSLTAISFMLDILKIFGITNDYLYRWLSNLLLDEEGDGAKAGILPVIEESIKAILLSYLTGLYTCPIDPIIPDWFLKTPYIDQRYNRDYPNGVGLSVPLSQIDAFGLLQSCPTSPNGSVFYFDTIESGYTPSTVWKSTDFNAYLWYVINKGNGDTRSIWDNRVHYRRQFSDPDGGATKKDTFVEASCQNSPTRVISGIGAKKQIIITQFRESGMYGGDPDYDFENLGINALNESNSLVVWGVADRYSHNGFNGMNKTVFQFNTDYIYSLKLFDSKTLAAQIINSLLGLSSVFSMNFSIEMNVLARKVEKLVEKVIEQESSDESDFIEDGYFIFSDEEYNEIENDATLRYLGKYESKNDTNELIDLDREAITTYISEISLASTPEEKENAIIRALEKVGETVSLQPEIKVSAAFNFNKNLIFSFIKEAMVQISMQVLSPKVMLLFAINSKFLGDEDITDSRHWEQFFKNFWNILRSCIRKIADLILRELLDLVIGQIKPILSLVIKKLMLETIYYYRILLEDLILNCVPKITFGNNTTNMVIDNVDYADIIPKQTVPES